jgi:predicted amidohydrolase YtcJ
MTHFVNTPAVAETAIEVQERLARKYKSEHAWFDTMKLVADSVMENQKAAMLEPYLSTGDPASLYFDRAALEKLVFAAAEKGHGTATHCIGDRAVREALDAAEGLRKSGDEGTRFIATHVQMVDPEDRKRFGKLDVIVQTTSNWANHQPTYVEHIGQERNDTLQFPFRSWVDGGAVVALGADWPATPGGFEHGVNPFNNIYVAMHRRVPKDLIEVFGSADRTLPPENEVLTLAEAIQGYTINGAKLLGMEDEIGSIEAGKKADMILLSQNLFEIDPEEIPKTRVLGTMFDGRIVHDVLYGKGDSNLVDLDKVGEGATGPCLHGAEYMRDGEGSR